MDWRSKPRKREELSPNWRDIRNKDHNYEHNFLSPEKSRKILNNVQLDRKQKVFQDNLTSSDKKKLKFSIEKDMPLNLSPSLVSPFDTIQSNLVTDVISHNTTDSLSTTFVDDIYNIADDIEFVYEHDDIDYSLYL